MLSNIHHRYAKPLLVTAAHHAAESDPSFAPSDITDPSENRPLLKASPDDDHRSPKDEDKRSWPEKIGEHGWALFAFVMMILTFLAITPSNRGDDDDDNDAHRTKRNDRIGPPVNLPPAGERTITTPFMPMPPAHVTPTDTAATARAYLDRLPVAPASGTHMGDVSPDAQLMSRLGRESSHGDIRLRAHAFTAYLADFWARRAREHVHAQPTWSAHMIEAQKALPRSNFRTAAAKHQAVIDRLSDRENERGLDRGMSSALQAHELSAALFTYAEAFSANAIATATTPIYLTRVCSRLVHRDFDALPESAQTTARDLCSHTAMLLAAYTSADEDGNGAMTQKERHPSDPLRDNGQDLGPNIAHRELVNQAWNIGAPTMTHTSPSPHATITGATRFTSLRPMR